MVTLCAGTPSITVRDNRGLDVRGLRYNRSADGDVATQYVDAQTHSVLGQPTSSQDPRFFNTETLNFQYIPALSGQVLRTVSVDAGIAKACADIAGQPIWQHSQGRDCNKQSDNNITVQLYYDALGRPVQRNLVTSDVSTVGQVSNTSDIWCYGDYSGPAAAKYDPINSTDPRNANQRGQVFQHFDTAGLIDMSAQGYAVHGVALRQDRRFQATPCDTATHWQPALPPALYDLNKQWLESDSDPNNLYSTRWAYNAVAQALTQVDAKGHQQQTAYDCAGRKCATLVTPKAGTLTPVTTAITYNATGAIDTRNDANNIQVSYAYEPQTTQRLISLIASRSAAASNDGKSHDAIQAQTSTTALQALTYAYDGVGNVIALSDSSASEQVSFFRNRAVTPDRGYTYDALYQLTSATGRENYVNNTPKGTDWPGGQINPTYTPDYQTYTRSYTYDPGGNLTTIRSSNWSGAAPPTRQLVVGSTSNRAVCTANNPGPTQANIDTYFDLAGKSICLDANRNQPMYWTAFHQLYCVVTTYRAPTPGALADWSASDREQYAYDGNGQRVRKYASKMVSSSMARDMGGNSTVGNTWNTSDTRYLPGLEIRNDTATGENLEVIILNDGARLLNWVDGAGKPCDIPNLQLRYEYSDRQNSCQIETDSIGNVITKEEYYPYGGTAVLASRSDSEVKYKYIRYSDKERDATGLYYYGLRYYQPWVGRWINPDPAGSADGQNLYRMVRNNPVTLRDQEGLMADAGPAQSQAQEKPPMRPKLPPLPPVSGPAPVEVGLGWKRNSVLKDKDWDGKQPGTTLYIRNPDGTATNFGHGSHRKCGGAIVVLKSNGHFSHTAKDWIKAMGLTVARTLRETYESSGSRGKASVSLPTFTVNGEVRRLSHETYMKVVLPLAGPPNSGSEENSPENIARFSFVNLSEAQHLAQKATLALTVHRIVQQHPQWLRIHRSPEIQKLREQFTAAFEKITKSLDFAGHQELLFGYLEDRDQLQNMLARVLNGEAPENTIQAFPSTPVVLGKRRADPAGESASSKITAPSGATSQSNASAAAVAAIPHAPGALDREQFPAQPLPSISNWFSQHPALDHPQPLSFGSDPSIAGSSRMHAASDYGQGSQSQLMQLTTFPYGPGDTYPAVFDAPGPSQAPGAFNILGQQAMPAQQAFMSSASFPHQSPSQQRVSDDPWDEFDPTLFIPLDSDLSQHSP